MKKLYLQFLFAIISGNNKQVKAIKIFFLAFVFSCIHYHGFAQVTVGTIYDTTICSNTAVSGTAPSCTTLGGITITEAANGDFASGTDQITLHPPVGWQFCSGPCPTLSWLPGDITAVTCGGFTASAITITITSGGVAAHDAVTITGLQVQPVLVSAAPGYVYAQSATGVNGIITGAGPGTTDFASLALIPGVITGSGTVCVGTSDSLSDPTAGGIWTITSGGAATIGSTSGVVTGITAGSGTVSYTVAGCRAIFPISIAPAVAPIAFVHNLCAWGSTETVTDATVTSPPSVWTSTLVTITGSGLVTAYAAGIATITYTTPSGCMATAQLTVNPLPDDIPGTSVCQGSTVLLTGNPCGGTWSSINTLIATVISIDPCTGSATGVSAGIDTILYTLPTGCSTYTTVTVNPNPSPITGIGFVCSGLTTTLTATPAGGIWSSSNTGVAVIDPFTGVVTGDTPGTAVIIYTLSTSCATITTVTVDPIPGSIEGSPALCVNDSVAFGCAPAGGFWSSSSTSIATVGSLTGVVTGVSSGSVMITYTLEPGNCFTTYTLTINPLPGAIDGPDSICVGGTPVHESDPSGGGSWSTTSGGVIAYIDPFGFVTGNAAGVDTIVYMLPTGCRVTKTITVDPIPAPIIGPGSICVGDTIVFSESTTGGVWTSGSPFVATVDSVTGRVVGLTPGVTPIYYTIYPGGCTPAGLFELTVNAIPTITAVDTTVCQGSSVTLTAIPPGGTWSSANTLVATIDSLTGVITGVAGGTTNITYTRGGCPGHISFTVFPVDSIVGPTHVICMGDTITLSNGDPTGTWSHKSSSVTVTSPAAGIAVVAGIAGGVDTVVYTLPTGCFAEYVITVNPTAPIAGPSAICQYTTALYTDGVLGGTWTTYSGGVIATIDASSGVLLGNTPGVDTIYYTLPTGCMVKMPVTVNAVPGPIGGSTFVVCVGSTIVLTDDTTGGIWTTSNVGVATVDPGPGSPTTVGGVSAGTVTISYILPTGCSVDTTVLVNPISNIFGGDSQVCVGSTIILVDTTAGGTWINGNPGIASIVITGTGDSIFVVGGSAGFDTITYLMPTGCSAQFIVTVNPLPDPIIGADSLCKGATTTYVDSTMPGVGVWTSSNLTVATIDSFSGLIFGVNAGISVITYTLPTGCFVTKIVTVNPLPGSIIGPVPAWVCNGFTIAFSDPTVGGVWTSSDTLVATIDTTGLVTSHNVGTTVISYTLATGCGSDVIVTVNPIPVITITDSVLMICKGGSDRLTASGAASVGGPGTYVWTPATSLSCTACASTVASPTVSTTYTVTGTTFFGCVSDAVVTVWVDSALNHMMIVGRDSICAGQCDTLMASGRAHTFFNWHPNTGLSCTICDTVVACPVATTDYTAVAIDDIGCKDSISFLVTVNQLPVLKVDPSPVIICRGVATPVFASGAGSSGHYAWSPNVFLSCDTCYDPILTDTFNIVYKLVGITQFGCADSINVRVSVLDTNVNTISAYTNICIGDSTQLVATSHSVTSNLDVPTFLWTPATGLNNPYIPDPVATPTSTTTYSVTITENACFTKVDTVTVIVQPLPVIGITVNPPTQTVIAGTPVTLSANVTNVVVASYAWVPGNSLSCDSCYNPVATPTVATTYTVTVVSDYGCVSYDTVSIHMFCDNSEIFVPNTFTPNGDGINDRFYVSGKGISLITNFVVYNRWGQMVFEAHNINPNDPGSGWDGTFKGLVLEPDVFVYIVDAVCVMGEKYHYKGDISLVR